MKDKIIALCFFLLCISGGLLAQASKINGYEYWFDEDHAAAVWVSVPPTTTLLLDTDLPTNALPGGLHALHIRFRDETQRWSCITSQFFYKTTVPNSGTPKIKGYEYWYDEDYAARVSTSITPTPVFTLHTDLTIAPALPVGLHALHIRFQDENNAWSGATSQFFYKTTVPGVGNPRIKKYEYWYDEDYVGRISTSITPTPVFTLNTDLTIAPVLPIGLHALHIRFQDENNAWSGATSQFFYKTTVPGVGNPKIKKYEYWYDEDYAGRTSTSITPTPVFTLNTDLTIAPALPIGLHTLHLRFQDENNAWSGATSQFFYKTTVPGVGNPKIKKYEYWYDEDYAGRTSTSITPTPVFTLNADLTIAPALPGGLHALHLRFQDENNAWSGATSQFFYKTPPSTLANKINLYRYWFDNLDHAITSVEVSPPVAQKMLNITPSVESLSLGQHTVHFQFRDIQNNWSGVTNDTFTVVQGNPMTFYADTDGDTYGDLHHPTQAIFTPSGFVSDSTDCNDTNAGVHPGATEVCNGMDDDCDNLVDEGLLLTFFPDSDGDGYGGLGTPVISCTVPPGYANNNTDCDDTNPAIYPGRTEICNSLDDDCDGQTDEGVQTYYYADMDGDHFGDPDEAVAGCSAPANFVPDNTDCDDSNPTIHPGATEICNGIDDNCDGIIDLPAVILPAAPGVCANNSTILTASGGTGYLWNTGQTTSAITVSPTLTTVYTVAITDTNLQCTVTASVTVQHLEQPATPANFFPANGTPGLAPNNIMFSWASSPGATAYDFYSWKQGQSEPVQPTVANITQINLFYSIPNPEFGATYHWKIVAKNSYCSTDGPIVSFTLLNLPDLIVQNVQAPATAFTGQALTVSWQVKNMATGSTGMGQWNDAVYLSADNVLDVNIDQYLGAVANFSALAPNQSYSNTASFPIPNGFTGSYYVFIWTDRYGYVSETAEGNNTGISPTQTLLQLTPPPDLQVTSIVPPNNLFSGAPITVNWTVTNEGVGETRSGVWQDRIYFGPNAVLNLGQATLLGTRDHSGNLDVHESYSESIAGAIPQGIFGTYYVHVTTDFYNNEYEHANEGNNTTVSTPITVTLTPPADLVLTSLTAPTNASNRQNITVIWTGSNEGGASAPENWYDAVYLSPTANNTSLTGATLLGTVNRPNGLELGENYSQSLSVQIPDGLTGDRYIHVKTDAGGSVFEYTFEQNNVASAAATDVRTPDLKVENLTAPVSGLSGDTILVQWSLKNTGTGNLLSRTVKDKISLSTSPTYIPTGQIALGEVAIITTLNAGANVARQKQVVLPNGIAGQYYLYVHTDQPAEIYENGSDANNYNSAGQAISIALSPWVDLTPTVISPAVSGLAGGSLAVSYTVQNMGSAAAQGLSWKDKIFIQNSPTWNATTAQLLRTENIGQNLPVGGSYAKNSSVSLPLNLPSGNYYFFMVTDADNDVYENTGENNNRLASTAVAVTGYPPVDLRLDTLTGPGAAMSGQSITANWSVTNIAADPTIAPNWLDAVYLSPDAILSPATDQLLTTRQQSGPLAAGASYAASKTFTLPNGISGTYYLIAVTDYTGLNNDSNLPNNRKASAALVLTLTPPPDLLVSSMTAPAQAFSGQSLPVYYSVQNNGTGSANGSWTDKIYLSTDLVLGNDDVQVGSKTRSGGLGIGATYNDTLEANIPLSQFGNRILILQTDDNNVVYEYDMEGNNTASSAITLVLPPPSDLVVSAANAPAMAIAGEAVTIHWTVKNTGANPAIGAMKEAVYFSADSLWDVGDALLGTRNTSLNLAPNGTASQSLSADLMNVSLGDYYVIVRTDILDNINESNDTNNLRVVVPPVTVSVNLLPLNVLTPNILADNMPLYYRIEVPDSLAGETLLVTLKADSLNGSNELYLRFGQAPTRSVYDFAYSAPFSGNQEVIVPALQAGTYYLLAYGGTTSGDQQNITLLAEILDFEIRSVRAGQGGDNGFVTVEIKGSKFEDDMELRLEKNGDSIIASNVQYVDPTKAFATFDLDGKTIGVYDVSAEKFSGEIATLSNGFEIVIGGSPDLAVNILQPANTSPNQIVTIKIEYANNGTIDILNPIAMLKSLGGSPVSLDVTGLNSESTSLDLSLMELAGPTEVLRPGGGGLITIYVKVLTKLGFTLNLPSLK